MGNSIDSYRGGCFTGKQAQTSDNTCTVSSKKFSVILAQVTVCVVYFTGCLVLVCLSLFESALVSYFSKPSDENNHHQMAELSSNKVSPGETEDKEENFSGNNRKSRRNKILKLHKLSRIVLPAGFLMFNMAYWIYYL